jgi:hypothetical protein
MAFDLMGKSPIRFKYTDEALEASWTFAPGDPDLAPKLQRMLDFLKGMAQSDQIFAALAMEDVASQRAEGRKEIARIMEPPALPERAIANGWEVIADGDE